MKFILEFTAVFMVGIVNYALGTFFYIKNPDYSKLFTASEQLLRRWFGAMSGIIVVLLVALDQPNGFSSVGIHTENGANNRRAIILGWLAVSMLVIVYTLIHKLLLRIRKEAAPTTLDTSQPWIVENMRYRDRWERLAYLTVLPLEVISEDLVSRGYLVLLLGNKFNMIIPWAIISVILSVAIHLYQGRNINTILFHAVSASFLAGLTIATQNILAPIAAHLYYNLPSTIRVWRGAKGQGIQISKVEHSRKKKFAYTIFIAGNMIFLCISSLFVFLK